MSPRVQALRENSTIPKQGEFTKEEARAVYIRGYAVTSAEDKKPILGTIGADTCVIVAVYNPANRAGALSHFDTNTTISSLDTLVSGVGGAANKLEVTLAGGRFGDVNSHRLVEDIVERLSQIPNITIRPAGLLDPRGGLQSLALDTRTGATFGQVSERNMDVGPDRPALMMQHVREVFQVGPLRPEYINGQEFTPEGVKIAPPVPASKVGL